MKALITAIAVCIAVPVAAQQCIPDDEANAILDQRGQTMVGRGFDGQAIIEMWSGPDGMWTLLARTPTGLACLIASGTHFERVNDPMGEMG
jgi:hypothetical protein